MLTGAKVGVVFALLSFAKTMTAVMCLVERFVISQYM